MSCGLAEQLEWKEFIEDSIDGGGDSASLRDNMVNEEIHEACGIGAYATKRATHEAIEKCLVGIGNQRHRGSQTAMGNDGAGFLMVDDRSEGSLTNIQARELDDFKNKEVLRDFGVGKFFFVHMSSEEREKIQEKISARCSALGIKVHGWMPERVNDKVIPIHAARHRPQIYKMIYTASDANLNKDDAEILSMRVASVLEEEMNQAGRQNVYIESFSMYKQVYKGMIAPGDLGEFYPDLKDERMKANIVLYHNRFSTNTFPNWFLSHPYRWLIHNGEFNTIEGMRSAVRSLERYRRINAPLTDAAIKDLKNLGRLTRILMEKGSDSADFDRTVEAFCESGYSLMMALRVLMPAAMYKYIDAAEAELKEFYLYWKRQLGSLGAFDGPAAVVATDGKELVSIVDRSGYRPLRWVYTKNGDLYIHSERGAIPVPSQEIVREGQLSSGEMLRWKDGKLMTPHQCMRHLLDEMRKRGIDLKKVNNVVIPAKSLRLTKTPPPNLDHFDSALSSMNKKLAACGWDKEHFDRLREMMRDGKEPVGAMGYPYPLAILSQFPFLYRPYQHLKEDFAQVTNPPNAAKEERASVDTQVFAGAKPPDIKDAWNPEHYNAMSVGFRKAVIDNEMMDAVIFDEKIDKAFIDCSFAEHETLEQAVSRIKSEVLAAARNHQAIVLDDRKGYSQCRLPVSMMFAVDAIAQAFEQHTTEGLSERGFCIYAIASDAAEPHDVAAILSAAPNCPVIVNPRTVFSLPDLCGSDGSVEVPKAPEIVREQTVSGKFKYVRKRQTGTQKMDKMKAAGNLKNSFILGIEKIMSKIGNTMIDGYTGAGRLFNLSLACLNQRRFPTPFGGLAYKHMEQILRFQRRKAYEKDAMFERSYLEYDYMKHPKLEGLFYLLEQGAIPFEKQFEMYKKLYADRINRRESNIENREAEFLLFNFIDLLGIKLPEGVRELPISEVASLEQIIVERIRGAHISHAAITELSHEAIHLVFNEIEYNGKSGQAGSGEGGIAYWRRSQNTFPKSVQLGTAKFGTHAEILAREDVEEICIKITQGAKPGEGGQMPAFKVDNLIAKIRGCAQGTELISPPPHHDIYSIEDLEQLIFNLRAINPKARIAVKLTSGGGIGTIAAGVAKSGADVIEIDGYNGGTGAALKSSQEHAGLPTEIGLAEVHQTLLANGLRDKVKLRVGNVKTGTEHVKFTLLGADEVMLGTLAMVAEGCRLMRTCNDPVCEAMIAEDRMLGHDPKMENPEMYGELLRKRADTIKRMLHLYAREIQEWLQKLGKKDLSELVGKTELLEQLDRSADFPITKLLNLSPLLFKPDTRDVPVDDPAERSRGKVEASVGHELAEQVRNFLENSEAGSEFEIRRELCSCDRGIGIEIAGVAMRHKCPSIDEKTANSFPDGKKVKFVFEGNAGQSFGAMAVRGMDMILSGRANDGVGLMLSGGNVIVKRESLEEYDPFENVRIGNNFGAYAYSGFACCEGVCGQRMGVLNRGADLVALGCKDYPLQYMTDGRALILGTEVGAQIGAGMKGGKGFFFDPDGTIEGKLTDDVAVRPMNVQDEKDIKELLLAFIHFTDNPQAKGIFNNWHNIRNLFTIVVPKGKDVHKYNEA